MRLTFLTTLYPGYIQAFYRSRPGLEARAHLEQKAALDQDGFAWNGALEPAFAPLGYCVQSIYANVAPLQGAWAGEETGGGGPAVNWIEDVALLQIERFRPEILFVDDLAVFRARWIERARRACGSIRLVVGFCGVDVHDMETVKACDAIFTPARYTVDRFEKQGCKAFLLRHAFNPAILDRLPPILPREGLLFTGSMGRGEGLHRERERLVEALVGAVPITIHCPQGEISRIRDIIDTNLRRGAYAAARSLGAVGVGKRTLRRLPKIGRAADWTEMPSSQINPKLRPRMKRAVYGIEMFATMRSYSITLNRHIDMSRAEAGNCRLFEATGAGACLLTDWKPNLGEMFEADREVAVYRNVEEAVEKARWLMAHPGERSALGRSAQARVLREHTFGHRAAEFDRSIKTLGF
jgi:hypothetical protein